MLCATLAGCARTTVSDAPIETGAGFCAVAQPILWSPRDTDFTIEQVKEHNKVGAVLCGWASGAASQP
jgi:hypothetical protein